MSLPAGGICVFTNHADQNTADYHTTCIRKNTVVSTAVEDLYVYDGSAMDTEIDADYYGNVLILRDMEAEGDILHEDYMRKLDLQLEACDYSGAVISGTMANWNNWWLELEDPTEKPEAAGWDMGDYEFDRDELCSYTFAYTEYGDPLGVYLTMDENSSWTVTGDSSLTSLSLAEGAEIKTPEGKTLAFYVDVDMNSDGEYTGVVIRVF